MYNTASIVPLNIGKDEEGIDLQINQGKELFDSIMNPLDSTYEYIDYISILYDESNLITQSGSIHLVDQIMKVQVPDLQNKNYSFREIPYISNRKGTFGVYAIEPGALESVEWSGSDLYYVNSKTELSGCSNDDYLELDGDFEISYTIGPHLPGKYEVYINADSHNSNNAVVEVWVDGNKISSLLDFTRRDHKRDFDEKFAGVVNFEKYETHVVVVKSLIPGMFKFDYVGFKYF